MLHAFYTFLNISLLVVLLEDMLQEPKDTEETREKKTEEVIEMQAIASASQKEMEIICALSVLIFSNYLYCFNCLHQSQKFSLIGLID